MSRGVWFVRGKQRSHEAGGQKFLGNNITDLVSAIYNRVSKTWQQLSEALLALRNLSGCCTSTNRALQLQYCTSGGKKLGEWIVFNIIRIEVLTITSLQIRRCEYQAALYTAGRTRSSEKFTKRAPTQGLFSFLLFDHHTFSQQVSSTASSSSLDFDHRPPTRHVER